MIQILHYLKDPKLWELWYIAGKWVMQDLYHPPYWRVNNPTLWDFCVSMIGRGDIEGSRSNVAMNAWLPQASCPCGNFSDTFSWICLRPKGGIGHVFLSLYSYDNHQANFSPFGPHEISVLIELTLGHLRYHLTDAPPQPNSQPDYVFRTDQLPF